MRNIPIAKLHNKNIALDPFYLVALAACGALFIVFEDKGVDLAITAMFLLALMIFDAWLMYFSGNEGENE
jgi:hypothetical protein